MRESHSGYLVPPSQLEDVPIDNKRRENVAISTSHYESMGKPTGYKPSFPMAVTIVLTLASLSAVMIYMTVQSADDSSTLPAVKIVETDVIMENAFSENPFTENQNTENQNTEKIDENENTIRSYMYDIVPETLLQLKKREIQKLKNHEIRLSRSENIKIHENADPIEFSKTPLRHPRDLTKTIDEPNFMNEIFQIIDEQRNHEKRAIGRTQKITDCQRNSKHCRNVVESMSGIVDKAGQNVDDLRRLIEQVRSKELDPDVQDFLQCVECQEMKDNDDRITFIDDDLNGVPYYHRPSESNHRESQAMSVPSLSDLLDDATIETDDEINDDSQIDDSTSPDNLDSQTNSITSTITKKSGSNVEKTVEVSKSKKLTDGGEITQIIKNTTIIRKPEKNVDKPASDLETIEKLIDDSPVTELNFDSLMPIRPRPTMQVVRGGPSNVPSTFSSVTHLRGPSGWSEDTRAGFLEDDSATVSTVAPVESRSFTDPHAGQGPSEEPEYSDPFQPRILTGTHFQPSKSNGYVNGMTMPTAETMKSGQQVQYTPWLPYQVCYYGTPPAGLPSTTFKQTQPGTPNFSVSSPSAVNYPMPVNQYSNRASSGFSSQGYGPVQFPQQVPFGSNPWIQQGNMAGGYQQGHRVGPTGPGPQNFGYNYGNVPTGPGANNGRTPYYCTYVNAPIYHTAMMPGVSEFQRSAAGRDEDRHGDSENRYRGPEPAWSGNTTNYQGFPGDCDHNSYHCYDGSRCIPKKLWCDGSVDCPDVSDETRCSCIDRISNDRICDGYSDCPNDEDELGCFGCPASFFSCGDWSRRYNKDNCVPIDGRCDGITQCSNGKDEMDCAILTESYIKNPNSATVGFTSGYLHKNWRGKWYPVCTNGTTSEWAVEACSSENDLPLSEPPSVRIEFLPSGRYNGSYVTRLSDGQIVLVSTCSDRVIRVECPKMSCGIRSVNDDVNGNFGDNEDSLVALAKGRNNGNYFNGNEIDGDPIVGDSRVVGGRASHPRAWPFLVAIFRDGYFHCGGTIVDDEWVLTAAHCVSRFQHHHYEIQAGLLRRFSFSRTAQIRRAMTIIVHPDYDQSIMRNDLALIRLNQPLRFNRWIRPTCLPKNASTSAYWSRGPFAETLCVTIGWGAMAENGPDPDQLREVEVPILSQCKHLEDRHEAVICAGMPQGGRDACQGDSGGPLMCRFPESSNQWWVAGIVSHGDGCARPNEPGAYTKVSHFVDWIETTRRTNKTTELKVTPVQKCPGFSCAEGLGKCLPKHKRCDKIVNCLDAEDEIDCPVRRSSSFRSASSIEDDDYDGEIVAQINTNFRDTKNLTTGVGEDTRVVDGQAASSPSATQANDLNASIPNDSSFEEEIDITTETRDDEIIDLPHFTCTRVLQTLPIEKRCDRVFDCEDGTDESDCKCKDYLVNLQPNAICDGRVDCYDGSDEENCTICEGNEFACRRSGKCIPQSRMCDDVNDCPHMEDELDCFALTNGNYVVMDVDDRPHLNLEGLLTKRKNNKWRPACQKQNETVQALISNNFCSHIGFRSAESFEEISVRNTYIDVRKSTIDNVIPYDYSPFVVRASDKSNNTCMGLYVRCEPILSANSTNLWALDGQPWQAHIYVEGRYHCPATLLDYSWLLASSLCAEDLDLNSNYTVVLFGTGPTHLHSDGPYQQRSSIDTIETIKKLDAAMFHIENPINITRYVRPIFLRKKIVPATVNDVCIATGVNREHLTMMAHVRPELTDCPPCHRCYKNVTMHHCKNENGTSNNWSGTVVCHGSNIWYPAAIFGNNDYTCGQELSEPMTSIDYGYKHITTIMKKQVHPTSVVPICDGLRCPLGNCVSWNKVCDGIDDCRDGDDESDKNCGTRREFCKNKNAIGCQCKKSELRCASGQCVPKEAFCDFTNDCDDGSDEPVTCNCAAYLNLTAPELLCDNVQHCFDKSDEDRKYCPCKDASFQCNRGINNTESCISQDFVCNGIADCEQGEDESTCMEIKGTLKDPPGTGEVMRRSYGVWHSECRPTPFLPVEISEMCRKMGYDFGRALDFENGKHPYGPAMTIKLDEFHMIRFSKSWLSMRSNRPLVTLVTATEPCHRAFVQCVQMKK